MARRSNLRLSCQWYTRHGQLGCGAADRWLGLVDGTGTISASGGDRYIVVLAGTTREQIARRRGDRARLWLWSKATTRYRRWNPQGERIQTPTQASERNKR